MNPKQLERFRDGYTVAGAKDDRRRAYVLADTWRTSRNRYRRLKLGDPKLIVLRALIESTEELLVGLRVGLHRDFGASRPLLATSAGG